MILAAGRGERLRPLTERLPKPMIPIANEPLIVHQLGWLHRAGIRDVVINLRHLAEQVERELGNGARWGLRIRYSHEEERLETGGGVQKALPHLRPGPFLVLNGDIWTDFPFASLRSRQPKQAHLVLTPKPPHVAKADFHLRERRVCRGTADDLTYCGIAVVNEALFQDAPSAPFSLAELFFRAAAAGQLDGERFDGAWIDIGTPEQLERARRSMP